MVSNDGHAFRFYTRAIALNHVPAIPYPRYSFRRKAAQSLGRPAISLLSDLKISGRQNFPAAGPLILAGNHVGFMEIVLMVVFSPYNLELVGTGDIPMDPTFAPIAKGYGFIPLNRGNLDRNGLYQALNVLKQGGVLGVFPEGGIWNPDAMPAHAGIAWLSSAGQAPILPIGFGIPDKPIKNLLQLKHPRFEMNIGPVIPPVNPDHPGLSRKAAMEVESRRILQTIHSLVPAPYHREQRESKTVGFVCTVTISTSDGKDILPPADLALFHASQLSRMLQQPVIMDVFTRNLKLPVAPLNHPEQKHEAHRILVAVSSILDYLVTNPGFLTYRFGIDEGLAMHAALSELKALAAWAAASGYDLHIHLHS
jgi:1-acyl-sn-glycerol-3-phosphate acyltransferase